MAVQHQMTGSCFLFGSPVWPWGCRSVWWGWRAGAAGVCGGDDMQAALVSCYFLDVLFMVGVLIVYDPWAILRTQPMGQQARLSLALVCLQCACPYEWCLSLGCFSHIKSCPDLTSKFWVALQRCSGFIWSNLGYAVGLLRHSKNVGSRRGWPLLYKDRGENLCLFNILFFFPCPNLPIACCPGISCPFLLPSLRHGEEKKTRFTATSKAIRRRLASCTLSSLWIHQLPGASQMSSSPDPSSRSIHLCPVNDHTGFENIHTKQNHSSCY